MTSLERMLWLFDLSSPGKITDWGQTTAFMTVIAGVVARALYLFGAKLKRRSCIERRECARELSDRPMTKQQQKSSETWYTEAWSSFHDVPKVLSPSDWPRQELAEVVWKEIDIGKIHEEFLNSAALNDVPGLVYYARYINDISTVADRQGRTALHIALEGGYVDAIKVLMTKNQTPGQSANDVATALEELLDTKDFGGRKPQDIALTSSENFMNPDTVEAYFSALHPVEKQEESGPLSRTIAVVVKVSYGHIVLQLLLKMSRAKSFLDFERLVLKFMRDELDHYRYSLRNQKQKLCACLVKLCHQQYEDGNELFSEQLHRLCLRQGNFWHDAHVMGVVRLFLDKRSHSTELLVETLLRAAAHSDYSLGPIKLLLTHSSTHLHINENVLVEAVGNSSLGAEILDLLLENGRQRVKVTSQVLLRAMRNDRYGFKMFKYLLSERPDQTTVTESIVVEAVGSNKFEYLELLLNERPIETVITTRVLITAARHIAFPRVE